MFRPCPTCKKHVPFEGNPFRPFCSKRCRLIDLGLWATEGYVISGKSSEIDETNLSTSESESPAPPEPDK
jgi:endogenous inhibitor of DNA gyrase (YacG/DUF329 family)